MKRPSKGAAKDPCAPIFAGKLAEPVNGMEFFLAVLVSTGPEGQAAIDEANAAMLEECLGKIPLLAAHYSVDWDKSAPDWAQLAIKMAFDLVPGFKLKFPEIKSSPKPKPGRPAERDWRVLHYRADHLIRRGMKLTEACRLLSESDPDFQGLLVDTLISKFNGVKRSLVKAASDAIMQETMDDEKPTDMQKPN